MEPVVAPVAEGVVARSSDEPAPEITHATSADVSPDSNENSNGSAPAYNAAQAESDAITEKPHRTSTDDAHPQDTPHDKQPA
jgi:hypothetical protein